MGALRASSWPLLGTDTSVWAGARCGVRLINEGGRAKGEVATPVAFERLKLALCGDLGLSPARCGCGCGCGEAGDVVGAGAGAGADSSASSGGLRRPALELCSVLELLRRGCARGEEGDSPLSPLGFREVVRRGGGLEVAEEEGDDAGGGDGAGGEDGGTGAGATGGTGAVGRAAAAALVEGATLALDAGDEEGATLALDAGDEEDENLRPIRGRAERAAAAKACARASATRRASRARTLLGCDRYLLPMTADHTCVGAPLFVSMNGRHCHSCDP